MFTNCSIPCYVFQMAANYNKPKPLDPVYWHASSRFLVASGVEVTSRSTGRCSLEG